MEAAHPLAVVTPTLDGDVLARLALADVAFTPGQLQRLMPDASVDGVRKVLNRLAAQGVVTATRVGNAAITYALNREHLAAEPIVALANQALTLRQRIGDLLTGWRHPPLYSALFGSWARATATKDSDIDLFLIRPFDAPETTWQAQVDSLEDAVSRWTGNDARCFVVDEDRLAELRHEPVLESILREGSTLFGKPGSFRRALKGGTNKDVRLLLRAHDEG